MSDMKTSPRLSPKSVKVLNLISAGHSYSQIVEGNSDLNYHDIFFAAEEALWLDERIAGPGRENETAKARPTGESSMARAKQAHPRAYSPWSTQEDVELAAMHSARLGKAEMAERLKRQPSAIQSRLQKLGLA